MIEMIKLKPELITRENFQRFGEVCLEREDTAEYDKNFDLDLSFDIKNTRFWIMKLGPNNLDVAMDIGKISRHVECSQCLGSVDNKIWYVAVCPPNNKTDIPDLSKIQAFEIPSICTVKINPGTWHEGPRSKYKFASYYNLEHKNTKSSDYLTHYIDKPYRIII